jgi:MerR family mercuric resistance operon transcriptional regulator
MVMTISELARSSQVGVETVRFYQRRGLLFDPRPGLSHGGSGRRHYSEADLHRLRFIRAAQRAGFTLEEIGELLALDGSDDRVKVRQMARTRIAALDERIAELQSARQALEMLAGECAMSDKGPCPIIAAFSGAQAPQ